MSIGCDNPHIVHVFTYEKDIHEGDGIVMEYIEGRTLDEFLSEKPSLKTRQRIFGELLSAVAYLHKRGIIHNDLKLENILITRADDTLKLIDFGLADNDAFYVWKTLGCTKEYASPELISQLDMLIQEVKSEISRIFDESQGDVLKMAEEYTEYQNKIISETEDVELRNVLQNEMVLHYTKEFERVFGK